MLNEKLLPGLKKKQTITFILSHDIGAGTAVDIVTCEINYSGKEFTLTATEGQNAQKTVEYIDSTAVLTPIYCYIQPIDWVESYTNRSFTCTGLHANQKVHILATATL